MVKRRPHRSLSDSGEVAVIRRQVSATDDYSPKELMAIITRQTNQEIDKKLAEITKARRISN